MKYIITLLSFLIFIGLVFFYLQIAKPEENIKKIKHTKDVVVFKESIFKIEKPSVYYLPAKVLYMKIDFQKIKYRIIYKVIIKNIDKFALFNIKTILDNNNISYSVYSAKKSEIYIFFKNLAKANSVLNLFKEYNFNIKIEKIKKRI